MLFLYNENSHREQVEMRDQDDNKVKILQSQIESTIPITIMSNLSLLWFEYFSDSRTF